MKHRPTHESRVLVADDDQSIRQLVRTIVRRENIEIDAAVNGLDAIEKLKKRDYAVILLDLMMPRLDGFGVIEYLKTYPPPRKPVVVVITAYADQKFKEVDAEIVAGVLRKPLEIADLGDLVKLCISGFESAIAGDLNADERSIRELAEQRWNAGTSKDAGKGRN